MIQAAPLLAAHQPRLCLVHQTGVADAAEVTQAYARGWVCRRRSAIFA